MLLKTKQKFARETKSCRATCGKPYWYIFFPSTKELIKAIKKKPKVFFRGGSGYNYLLDFRDVIEAKGGAGKLKFVSTELIYWAQ